MWASSPRQDRWRAIPERLDGSGATVSVLAAELLAAADELVDVLKEQQTAEMQLLVDESARLGERRLYGRQAIEERHRREQRRVRTDELRARLAILRLVLPLPPRRRSPAESQAAGRYRSALGDRRRVRIARGATRTSCCCCRTC